MKISIDKTVIPQEVMIAQNSNLYQKRTCLLNLDRMQLLNTI